MPATEIHAYRDRSGDIPVTDWLENLEGSEPEAYAKCLARILELSERGYEMRRPHADYLRDGIYELRANGTPYRILYFFHGKNVVVLSHGIRKKSKVPPRDIDVAIQRASEVRKSPVAHIAEFNLEG